MKTKVLHRHIEAAHTNNPGEIDRLMVESEKITMPDDLYKQAADIAVSVAANVPFGEEPSVIIAVYILRYALFLSKSGQLIEVPTKPERRPV